MPITVRQSATRLVVVAVVTTIALAGLVGNAAPAQAWYRAAALNRPGPVSLSPPMAIDEYDGFVRYLTWRTARGPLVYRSPATKGPQNVAGVYQVQEWTPSFGWTTITQQVTGNYRIPRGVRSVRLPELYRAPQVQRGFFRVAWAFSWVNARTGASLGTSGLLPDRASDHTCATWSRPCVTGDGYIRTGRLHTHGGGW